MGAGIHQIAQGAQGTLVCTHSSICTGEWILPFLSCEQKNQVPRGTRDPGIVLRRIRIEVCLDTLSEEVGTALNKVRVSESVYVG